VKLATDMVAYGFKDCYDMAILVSGDSDYRPAIQWIKKLNKKVEVWSFKKTLSYRIKKEVNESNIIYLDNYLDELIKS